MANLPGNFQRGDFNYPRAIPADKDIFQSISSGWVMSIRKELEKGNYRGVAGWGRAGGFNTAIIPILHFSVVNIFLIPHPLYRKQSKALRGSTSCLVVTWSAIVVLEFVSSIYVAPNDQQKRKIIF